MKKIKEYLTSKNLFILILTVAIAIRLYYFFLTGTQTIWWDEAEYLSTAKHWAFNVPYDINPQRPILFPLLEAFFLLITHSELITRFLLVLLPSIGVVIVSYFLGKEWYNKKIGLISSFIMAVFWLLIFNTTRLHVEALLMFFIYLTLLFFWKGFIKENNKFKLLTGLFLGLSFLTKFTTVLVILTIIIFILIIKNKIFKDKYAWLTALIALISIFPYFIWSKIKFGSFLIFLKGSTEVSALIGGEEIGREFGWFILKNIPHFTLTLFFVFFFIGIITLYKLVLGFDLLIKNKDKNLLGEFFIVLFLIIHLIFFIFIQRNAEDRWLMPLALPLFIIVARGFVFLYKILRRVKIPQAVSIIAIVILILSGVTAQIGAADDIIKAKKDSYLQVKEAALWLKENTDKNDSIITASGPQTTYYSERRSVGYVSQDLFEARMREIRPKYITYSVFEKHPDWAAQYLEDNKERFVPIKAFFLDLEQQQLALVIYEIRYK